MRNVEVVCRRRNCFIMQHHPLNIWMLLLIKPSGLCLASLMFKLKINAILKFSIVCQIEIHDFIYPIATFILHVHEHYCNLQEGSSCVGYVEIINGSKSSRST